MSEGEAEDVLEEALDITRVERDPVRRNVNPLPDPAGNQQAPRIAAADLEILKGRFLISRTSPISFFSRERLMNC